MKSNRLDEATSTRNLRFDLAARPFLVLLELTRACDLACRHCRASAIPDSDPNELTTSEITALFDDLASLGSPRPIVVLTGGDPLRRSDLVELTSYGASRGLAIAVSPAGTPRANLTSLKKLRDAGASAVSFSIDGSTAAIHDDLRRVQGSFEATIAGCKAAQKVGLRLQVNTTVSAETAYDLAEICKLVAGLGASLWSVFFLIPTGRGSVRQPLSALGTEDVLQFLADAATVIPLKTTEAPAYRRVIAQRDSSLSDAVNHGELYEHLHSSLVEYLASGAIALGQSKHTTRWSTPLHLDPAQSEDQVQGETRNRPQSRSAHVGHGRRRPPLAVGDGRGVVFISHIGDVSPSGFLPLVAGNIRKSPLTSIYASSDLFRSLREPNKLRGRCGRCDFRQVCGGSRSQSYAQSGDPLGEDPSCAYQPSMS